MRLSCKKTFFVIADDDTYIIMDNLKKFLKLRDPNYKATYGCNFQAPSEFYVDEINKNSSNQSSKNLTYYNSGGAGYVISNSALGKVTSKLKENYNFCPMSGTEDMDIAACFEKLQISIEKATDSDGFELFHPFNVMDHINGDFPDWYYNYSVSPVRKVS
jgi:glycoprotein-N-acetylgalactosamine 3-beta-galactosyltransferase